MLSSVFVLRCGADMSGTFLAFSPWLAIMQAPGLDLLRWIWSSSRNQAR